MRGGGSFSGAPPPLFPSFNKTGLYSMKVATIPPQGFQFFPFLPKTPQETTIQAVLLWVIAWILSAYWVLFVVWFGVFEPKNIVLQLLGIPLATSSFAMVQGFFLSIKIQAYIPAFFAFQGVFISGLVA